MIELVEIDLLAIIGREELDGLAKEVLEDGQPEPIATCISEGLGTIKLYADPRIIPDDPLKRIWRVLAVCWLYNRLATMPEKREKEQAWAIGLLEDIRDGKFKNLLIDPDAPAVGELKWGSETKFRT
jgi:hypothetical protein